MSTSVADWRQIHFQCLSQEFFTIFTLLSYTISHDSLLSSSPISQFFLTSLLPQIHCSSISHRNGTGFLLGISAEHGITRHNKNRQKHSYTSQMKYPSKRKRVPRASKKKSETCQLPLIGVLQTPSLNNNDIYRENLAQTPAVSMILLQTCEPPWAKQNLNNNEL